MKELQDKRQKAGEEVGKIMEKPEAEGGRKETENKDIVLDGEVTEAVDEVQENDFSGEEEYMIMTPVRDDAQTLINKMSNLQSISGETEAVSKVQTSRDDLDQNGEEPREKEADADKHFYDRQLKEVFILNC